MREVEQNNKGHRDTEIKNVISLAGCDQVCILWSLSRSAVTWNLAHTWKPKTRPKPTLETKSTQMILQTGLWLSLPTQCPKSQGSQDNTEVPK